MQNGVSIITTEQACVEARRGSTSFRDYPRVYRQPVLCDARNLKSRRRVTI